MESDSLVAIQALNEGELSNAQHRTIIQKILALSSRLQECHFQYISRVGNNVAYKLAPDHAWQVRELSVWWDNTRVSPLATLGGCTL